jgi:hypothetical protein
MVFVLMAAGNVGPIEQLKNVRLREAGILLGIKRIPCRPKVWEWFYSAARQRLEGTIAEQESALAVLQEEKKRSPERVDASSLEDYQSIQRVDDEGTQVIYAGIRRAPFERDLGAHHQILIAPQGSSADYRARIRILKKPSEGRIHQSSR